MLDENKNTNNQAYPEHDWRDALEQGDSVFEDTVARKLAAVANESITREVVPYSSEQAERALILLKSLMPDITSESKIVYPGSAADAQCANVFGKNVVHVDPDEASIEAMHKAGFQGVASSFEEYLTDLPPDQQFDLIFSHNAGLVPPEALARIRSGGYVIANNWHGSANDLGDNTAFISLGAVTLGEAELISSEDALTGLGQVEFAIKAGALLTDKDEIDKVRHDADVTIMKQYKNTEAQWVFKKI